MFCWEILGTGIHVDVTVTPTTYESIAADKVHPFLASASTDDNGFFCGTSQR